MLSLSQLEIALHVLHDDNAELDWDEYFDLHHQIDPSQEDLAPRLLQEFNRDVRGHDTLLLPFLIEALKKLNACREIPCDWLLQASRSRDPHVRREVFSIASCEFLDLEACIKIWRNVATNPREYIFRRLRALIRLLVNRNP